MPAMGPAHSTSMLNCTTAIAGKPQAGARSHRSEGVTEKLRNTPYQITPPTPSKVAFGHLKPRALMPVPESPGTRRGMTHVD
ncbi:hypothetical protein EMIT0P176_110045 [Pseudomonas sp. IT-P176]